MENVNNLPREFYLGQNEKLVLDGKLTTDEIKVLQKLSEGKIKLDYMPIDNLKTLKGVLQKLENNYEERSNNEKSKHWISSMVNKIVLDIDKQMSEVETSRTKNTLTPKLQNTKKNNTVANFHKDVVHKPEKTNENLVSEQLKDLTKLGIDPKLLNGMELSLKGIAAMSVIEEKLDKGDTEYAKALAKKLLSDPKNFEDKIYEKQKEDYEKALKQLEQAPIKIDAKNLKGIDNFEGSLIKRINEAFSNTKVKFEEGGKTKEETISDYLVNVRSKVVMKFDGNNLNIDNDEINPKIKKQIENAIKENLPDNIKNDKLSFTLNFEDGVFSNSVKLVDIDGKGKNGKNVGNIEKLVTDTIDLTKEKILLKTSKNPEKGVLYVDQIKDDYVYKVIVGKGKEVIVNGKDLKDYLEKEVSKILEHKKEKLNSKFKEETKQHEKRMKDLVDAIKDIEFDKNEAILESIGFGGFKLSDGTTPSISVDGDKYLINIDGSDDLVLRKDGDAFKIRDDHKLLPELEVRNKGGLDDFYKLVKKTVSVNSNYKHNNKRLKEFETNSESGSLSKNMAKVLKAENKIYKEFLDGVANIKDISEAKPLEEKMEKELKKMKESKENKLNLEKTLDGIETKLGNISISKDRLLKEYETDDNVKSWLSNFGDKVTVHDISTKLDGENVIIKFDFDDNWIDEKFDSNIKVVIPKDKVKGYNDEAELDYILTRNVIPKIADLSQKGKELWNDENNKTITIE